MAEIPTSGVEDPPSLDSVHRSTTVRSEALPVASDDVDLGVSAEDRDSALRVDFSEVLVVEEAGRRVRRARDQPA